MNGYATTNAHANGHANGHLTHGIHASDYDVVIVGAGISGINTGYRIQNGLPGYSYTILEGRSNLGGTWDLFKYPGVRSDSDLHTFGFPFNPWSRPNPIATGESIVEYMQETVKEFHIHEHLQFRHKVVSADWNSQEQRWRLEIDNDGQTKIYHAKFVVLGTGYYDYEKPLQANIPGLEDFKGVRVHPQFWPEDLDYRGKKMVIVGSGATAITILPVVVERGVGSATMLQRSPSYVMSMNNRKPNAPKPWHAKWLPTWMSLYLTRIQFLIIPTIFFWFCRAFPIKARALLTGAAQKQLPKDFPMDPHFNPVYNPWDQRLCLCPNGDFFKAFATGKANVVTGTIKRVVADGIELDSGEKIEADIIVTATGLNLRFCGNIALTVDQKPVDIASRFLWRTSMLSDVPNLSLVIGYTNASWTLGSDSTARLCVRLLKFMQRNRYTSATARISKEEKETPQIPLQLTSTYIKQGLRATPMAGSKGPWLPRTNYLWDDWKCKTADLREGLEFKSAKA